MARVGIIYLIVINILGLIFMVCDKHLARKGRWRISEKTLIMIAVIGGSVGAYMGMILYRHKTKHNKFRIGLPLILLIQLLIAFAVIIHFDDLRMMLVDFIQFLYISN